MAKNRIGLQFKGMEELVEKLDKLGGDLKSITNEALKASHQQITPKLHEDMTKHYRTGDTEGSIVDDAHVNWEGTVASTNVGFSFYQGGLPSIFLMYGTPRMKPDKKLYNDIYGTKTKKETQEIQRKMFADAIKKKMEG